MKNKYGRIITVTLKIVYLLVIISAILTSIYYLYNLQIKDNARVSQEIIEKNKKTIYDKTIRGDIVTKDGSFVAKENIYYILDIDPTLLPMELREEFLKHVNNVMNIDINHELKQINDLKESDKTYLVGYPISYEDSLKLKEEINKFKNSNDFYNHFDYIKTTSKREYSNYDLYKNIVGYIRENNKYGIESSYDELLTGKSGIEKTLKLSNANLKYVVVPDKFKEKKQEKVDSYNIRLSIDSIIQNDLDNILKEAYETDNAVSTMGIVFEIEKGKILALSQYPKSDNVAYIKNYNITNLFEPGSIFKPIMVSIALNEGKVDENTLIHSDGFIKVKDRIIRDHDDTTKGTLSLTEIIAHSGNVAMVKIADMIDNEVFYKYLQDFGFDSKTGIDIDYEYKNNLPPLKQLTEVRKSNISFGQGISATQIQMLMSLVATINGGELIKPSIVDSFYTNDGEIIPKEKEVIRRVISEKSSEKIRKMLSSVVTSGTGRGVKIAGYTIGGKTGTAQKAENGRYVRGKYYSSFFAFFPVDKPKYAILITVDEPTGVSYYGASVALPPAKQIIEKLVRYKDIYPDKEEELLTKRAEYNKQKIDEFNKKKSELRILSDEEKKEIINMLNQGVMPNLLGINKATLINIIPTNYKNVKILGKGVVKKQNIEVGTVINNLSNIVIEME